MKSKVTIRDINPKLARQWLDTKYKNRQIKPAHVEKLSNDMKKGNWHLNGSPFRFNEEGALIDGQHRARAIIQYGKSIKSYVITGLPLEAIPTIDAGVSRDYGDVLEINGEHSSKHLASAVKFLYQYSASGNFQPKNQSNAELQEILDKNPDLRKSVPMIKSTNKLFGKPGLMIVLHFLFSKIDSQRANEFFEDLGYGQGLFKGDPILTLREKWIKLKMNRTDISKAMAAEGIIVTWNRYRGGKNAYTLGFKGGPPPKIK